MKKDYVKYIVSMLLFGSNGIVASFISLNSYEVVLLRAFFGSTFLLLIFMLTKNKFSFLKQKKSFLFLVISGVAMGASWMFLYEAYCQIGVSLASLLYYCGPVIVMILSPLLFHEKLTSSKLVGFLCVLIGIFLVNGQAIQEGNQNLGLLCGVGSAIMYAVMVIANKKAIKITGLENSVIQLIMGFLVIVMFVYVKQGVGMTIATVEWIPILILGVINTGIGCYLYFSSIGSLPVQNVAICGYLELLSAVIFSAIFLREVMLPIQIVGAVLILGGAIYGVYKQTE